MDKVIYEDDPSGGSAAFACYQLILPGLVIAAVLLILIYSFNWGDWLFEHPWIFLIIYSPAFAFVWIRWPRKYQILDSRIRVLLQGRSHFDIPFKDIDHAGEGEEPGFWLHIGINLITAMINNIYIVRDPKMTINITPMNPKLFLENLNKAMDEWRQKNPEMKEEPLYPMGKA